MATPGHKQALSRMNKADVVLELTECKTENWSEKMSVVELKAILRQAREVTLEKNVLKGLSKTCIADLRAQYGKMGLGDPKDMTRGLLMAAIRKQTTPTTTTTTSKDEEIDECEWTEVKNRKEGYFILGHTHGEVDSFFSMIGQKEFEEKVRKMIESSSSAS